MNIVPSTFLVNYGAYDQNNSLDVRFNVYDCSGDTPSFVNQISATNLGNGAYVASVTGSLGALLLVIGMVYSGGIPDTSRAPGCDTYLLISGTVNESIYGIAYAAYDLASGLTVEAKVYDTGSLVDTIAMPFVALGVYFAKFAGIGAHAYSIVSIVTNDAMRSPGVDNYEYLVASGTQVVIEFSEAILEGQQLCAELESNCD